jgi:hypothetical protein
MYTLCVQNAAYLSAEVHGTITVLLVVNNLRNTDAFLAMFSHLLSRLENPFQPISLEIISRSPYLINTSPKPSNFSGAHHDLQWLRQQQPV